MKSFLSEAIYFQIAQISHRAQKLQHKSVQELDPSCAVDQVCLEIGKKCWEWTFIFLYVRVTS